MQARLPRDIDAAIELDALVAEVRHLQDITNRRLEIGRRDEGASLAPVRIKVSDSDVRVLTVENC